MKAKAIVFDAYGTLYDVQSVADVIDQAFPGNGEIITQVWRMKQLEYTWLRSLMGRYADFWEVTKESLDYTLRHLDLEPAPAIFDRIVDKYYRLDPYADAQATLAALDGYRVAILSNGSQAMLDELVRNSSLGLYLDAVLSIDTKRIFKPSPHAYELIEEKLGAKPAEVLFVSSNAFDACGAKNFGLRVAWIERATPDGIRNEIRAARTAGPKTLYKLMRMGMESFGLEPDYRIRSLSEIPPLLRAA